MKKRILIILLSLFTVSNGYALHLRKHYPKHYTVKQGDTLWSIAGTFLRNPWEWPTLWQNNRLRDPHKIYPGTVLRLTKHGKKVRLTTDTRHKHGKPIPTLPMRYLKKFMDNHDVLTAQQFKHTARVIALSHERLTAASGDNIYARGLGPHNHTQYAIVREGERLVDPVTKQGLGIIATHIGMAQRKTFTDPATLHVTASYREIMVGDHLLKHLPAPMYFYPHANPRHISGQIISALDGLAKIGKYDNVAINMGISKGVNPGTVFDVYRRGGMTTPAKTKHAVRLPNEKVGRAIVYRSFSNVSYALILSATRDLDVGNLLVTPS